MARPAPSTAVAMLTRAHHCCPYNYVGDSEQAEDTNPGIPQASR